MVTAVEKFITGNIAFVNGSAQRFFVRCVRRTSSHLRATCGRSPWRCGRSSHSPESVRLKHSPTTRSSTTVPAAAPVISSTSCSVSRPTARVRSTTSWSSVGTASRFKGRRSARFTCSCSARTWATHRPSSILTTQNSHRLLCRSSHLLHENCRYWHKLKSAMHSILTLCRFYLLELYILYSNLFSILILFNGDRYNFDC